MSLCLISLSPEDSVPMSDAISRPTCSTCNDWVINVRDSDANRGQCRGDLPRITGDVYDQYRGQWPVTLADEGCNHHQDYPAYIASLVAVPATNGAAIEVTASTPEPSVVQPPAQDVAKVPEKVADPVPAKPATDRPMQTSGQVSGSSQHHNQHARQGR